MSWRNPHGRLVLDVEDESGRIAEWEAETPSISVLRNNDTDPEGIVSVGDDVTVAGEASRRNLPQVRARNVLLPSGFEFDFGFGRPYFTAGRNGNLIVRRATTGEDVEAAIAAADGIFRVWSMTMREPAAWPLQGEYRLNDAGHALADQRHPFDNELLRCGESGMPRVMNTAFPFEIIRDGENIRMLFEANDARRYIYMTDAATPPSDPAPMGYSRGRFEGDTLVVQTESIAAGYLNRNGVQHSDRIVTVERFSPNEDFSRLDCRVSVTDPVYFAESFDLTRYFVWNPGDAVHPYECLDRY